jgi:hypothetical protein
MDNVHNYNNYNNIPSSQTCRLYVIRNSKRTQNLLIIILTEFVCRGWYPCCYSRHETPILDTNSHPSSEEITDLYEIRSSVIVITRVRVDVSNLKQIKPAHILPASFYTIHFNNFISSTPSSTNSSFLSDFSNFKCISYLYPTYCTLRPTYPRRIEYL